MVPILKAQEVFANDALFEKVSAYAEERELKNKTVIWALRIAVSGKAVTPAGATQIMEIIGKEETLARIAVAIQKLEK